MPTLCAGSCVGRMRYVGVVLYDAEKIKSAASASQPSSLYRAHLDILLDPNDPKIATTAAEQGISQNFIDAARRSPIFKLAKTWELAFPLHPEFRTLPMVWYIPPLSPIAEHIDPPDRTDVVDRLRIPITYLANLLTAGDEAPIRGVLKRLLALRNYMRSIHVEKSADKGILKDVGLTDVEVIGDPVLALADETPPNENDFEQRRQMDLILKKLTGALYRENGRILLGTDCQNGMVMPGFSIHRELLNLVEAGLTPYEAIKAGTADAAAFC